MIIKHCTAPSRSVYQVMRYVDGAAVAIAVTRSGKVSLYEERVTQVSATDVEQAWTRARESDHVSMLLERVVNAGYNVVAIADELRAKAKTRRAA